MDVKTVCPEELIKAYTGLIAKFALRYEKIIHDSGAIDFDDLMQEGRIALLDAQRTFDPEKEMAFISWASGYIKNRIRRAIGYKTDGFIKESPDLLLDSPIPGSDDDQPLIDSIPDESQEDCYSRLQRQEEAEEVRNAVDRLKDKEQREVISSLYFDGKDYNETAAAIGTSVKAVKNKKRRGLYNLRNDWKLRKVFLPDLRMASLGHFRNSCSSIEEEAILRLERKFDSKFGENAFAESIRKKKDDYDGIDY